MSDGHGRGTIDWRTNQSKHCATSTRDGSTICDPHHPLLACSLIHEHSLALIVQRPMTQTSNENFFQANVRKTQTLLFDVDGLEADIRPVKRTTRCMSLSGSTTIVLYVTHNLECHRDHQERHCRL